MKDAKGHGSDSRGAPAAPSGHEGNDFHRRAADASMQDELVRGNNQLRANADEWAQRGFTSLAAGNTVLAQNQLKQARDIYARLKMKP